MQKDRISEVIKKKQVKVVAEMLGERNYKNKIFAIVYRVEVLA